jgi:hypothetical protein
MLLSESTSSKPNVSEWKSSNLPQFTVHLQPEVLEWRESQSSLPPGSPPTGCPPPKKI